MGMYGERLGRGVTREAARKYETSVAERARRERWQASGCSTASACIGRANGTRTAHTARWRWSSRWTVGSSCAIFWKAALFGMKKHIPSERHMAHTAGRPLLSRP